MAERIRVVVAQLGPDPDAGGSTAVARSLRDAGVRDAGVEVVWTGPGQSPGDVAVLAADGVPDALAARWDGRPCAQSHVSDGA